MGATSIRSVGGACYDEGKRCAETLFFDYHRQHRVAIRVARIFNTFGPRVAAFDGRVVSNFIVAALRGEDMHLYGDGSQTRSFCYVDDLVAGLMAMMAAGEEAVGPINLGNTQEISMRTLGEEILALVPESRSKLVFHPLPEDDPKRRRPDNSRASRILNWQPVVPLTEGLRHTIGYFRKLMDSGRLPSSAAV